MFLQRTAGGLKKCHANKNNTFLVFNQQMCFVGKIPDLYIIDASKCNVATCERACGLSWWQLFGKCIYWEFPKCTLQDQVWTDGKCDDSCLKFVTSHNTQISKQKYFYKWQEILTQLHIFQAKNDGSFCLLNK